jgi:hypothetical protein
MLNRRTYRLILTLILLLSCLWWTTAAQAQSAPYAAIQTSATSVKAGDIFSVSVVAGSLTDAYSLDLGLSFDPSKVQVVDASGNPVSTVTSGDIFSDVQSLVDTVANNVNNGTGKIIYSCRIKTAAEGGQDTGVNITARKTVISFNLKAIQPGAVQVNFDPSFAPAGGQGILFSNSDTDDIAISPSNRTNLSLNISPVYQLSFYSKNDYSTSWSGDSGTVYIVGTGFQPNAQYSLDYYDASSTPAIQATQVVSADGSGRLESYCATNTNRNAQPGAWRVDIKSGGTLVYQTNFNVNADAIPEFPTAPGLIVVLAICVLIFWKKRKAALEGSD